MSVEALNTFMEILVSIPNTKRSKRFPGKNKLLAASTIEWLDKEIAHLPEDWNVRIIEVVSAWTDETCTPYEKFMVSYEDDHLKLTEVLQKSFSVDLHVHLQLTQPKRRVGLLKDCINTLLATNADVVSTYVKWRNDYNWRELKRDGDRVMFDKSLNGNSLRSFYDGAVYCAKDLPKIFDTTCIWDWCWNYKGHVIDVDYPEDYKKIII